MFKAIVLCALYNLSDDQVEYQIRDRFFFIRFLGLGLEDKVPDAKTVWMYREHLAQAGVIEALFDDPMANLLCHKESDHNRFGNPKRVTNRRRWYWRVGP
tara:strand:- start:732 stop:1031 length:300 start_codon:yes stop_codon:yes gene_type:complete